MELYRKLCCQRAHLAQLPLSFHGMKVLTAGQATGTGLEVGAVFEVELERLTNMGGGDTRHLDVSLMKNLHWELTILVT